MKLFARISHGYLLGMKKSNFRWVKTERGRIQQDCVHSTLLKVGFDGLSFIFVQIWRGNPLQNITKKKLRLLGDLLMNGNCAIENHSFTSNTISKISLFVFMMFNRCSLFHFVIKH